MPHRVRRLLVPATLAAVLALSGCSGSAEPDASTPPPSATPAAEQDAVSATTSASLAEQTFDATAGDDVSGGTITTTLRALEVSGETMTLRWAVRWDNDDAPDDATTHMFDLGIENMPTLTDSVNLKQYRPLCAEGSWQDGMVDQIACKNSALVSPSEAVFFKFPNHATIEAWAVFPAPQDDDAVFEALVAEGWPAFSGVRATTAP